MKESKTDDLFGLEHSLWQFNIFEWLLVWVYHAYLQLGSASGSHNPDVDKQV